MFHQIFAKIHSLILPIFFLWNFLPNQTPKMEVFMDIVNDFRKKVLNLTFILSWTKRFAIALMVKSFNRLNCHNGWCSRGIQVRYFCLTRTNILIWRVRSRTNNIKPEYVNVHHWEFDWSGTDIDISKQLAHQI